MDARRLAAVAGVLLVAGCGRAPFARGAGSHCPDGPPEHAQSLYDLVHAPNWAEVSSVSDRKGGPDPSPLRPAKIAVERRLRGDWPASADVGVDAGTVAEARAEQSGKARLLAVGNGKTAGLVSLRPNGEVHFLGACAEQMFRPDVEVFAKARAAEGDRRTEAELLLDAVDDPDGPAGATLTALVRRTTPTSAPAWRDRPADDRVLDSETPADVLAALEERTLVFRLPAGWRDAEVQLCPRVPGLAWGVCTVPQAAKGTIPLNSYAKPGVAIEIWVTDRAGGFRGERRLALTIPPATWSASAEIDVHGSASVTSREDAFRLAARGTAFRL